MSKEDEDSADCIVVRTQCCKRIVFAGVNEPHVMDTENFREIGKMVAKGCTVEHLTAAEVRKAKFGCKCERK
jgi:hypothetical protein